MAARNKGVSVVSFTATDIWEIYDARYAIESHAAARIIDGGPGMRARAIDDLRAVLERLGAAAKKGSHREISATDLDFHMTLVASGGNGRLVDAYSILSAQTLACINRLEIALPSRAKRSSPTTRSSSMPSPPASETKLLKAISDHLSVAASHLTTPPAKTGNSASARLIPDRRWHACAWACAQAPSRTRLNSETTGREHRWCPEARSV